MSPELSRRLRDILERERRPHSVDSRWELRESELALQQAAADASGADVAAALDAVLLDAGPQQARHALWLLFDLVPDAELAKVAEAAVTFRNPDTRLLTALFLVKRASSGKEVDRLAPAVSWLVEVSREAASRNLGPTIDVLDHYVANPDRFHPQRGYEAGAALFNQGQYFEAHEVWEDLWRVARASDRDFFQGLINLAVALKKIGEDNPNGLRRLLERARRLLADYAPAHRGVDVAGLLKRIDQLHAQAGAWWRGERTGIDPGIIPQLPVE